MTMDRQPIIQLQAASKVFPGVKALNEVSIDIYPGEVHCLLGDNGAGKSTLIKILSGVYRPDSGRLMIDGMEVRFESPRDALAKGLATVHQSTGLVPLMSVARNFFLGSEPSRFKLGPFHWIDGEAAGRISIEQLRGMGITRINDADQLVATMSGGERQALAISRATYFGARVLILDEPTAALGVKEAGTVLRLISTARSRGVAVVLITHNAHHALTIGDRFTVLIHGAAAAAFRRGERTKEEVLNLMAGGEELENLELELAEQAADAV